MDVNIFVDVVGWAGALLLLFAYFLVSSNRLQGQSFAYQSLNIFGSSLLSVNAGYYHAFPSVFVNIVWVFIGIMTLLALRKTLKH